MRLHNLRWHRHAEFHDLMLVAGGHRRGHGFGRHGGGFMGGSGMGGGGLRTGRKLGSGELQIVLLALLARQPSHGYELIKALEECSGGFYSPSPGMVYPALTYLEEVGYADVTVDGAKKRYNITKAGKQHLLANQRMAELILEQLARIGSKMDRVRMAFSSNAEEDRGNDPEEIWLARQELLATLRERREAGPKEARRIAEVLRRAVAQIRGEE